jgi:hypothetical protein
MKKKEPLYLKLAIYTTGRKKGVGVHHKKAVGDLSCTSEIIEKLLTVILRNNFLRFDGSIWSQLKIKGIAGQYGRFVPFPRVHDEDQSSDELEAIVEAIVGQSKVFGRNRDEWK